MKLRSLLLPCVFLLGCATSRLNTETFGPSTKTQHSTHLEVVELTDYRFTANSFFEERKDVSFREKPADQKFFVWAEEAIGRVNQLVPSDARISEVKLKLIFKASITSKMLVAKDVPISVLESYQEPKTNSIRLGMFELQNDKLSFQLTVAHEYAHLVFENASRKAGVNPTTNDQITFWPKSVYEGLADLIMSLAMNFDFTAAPGSWAANDLNQFKSLAEAKAAKDNTVSRAKADFKKKKLIPKYQIYEDWLLQVSRYIKSQGGVDPYAEGRWFAGSLKRNASSPEKRQKLIQLLLESSKLGAKVEDIQKFHDGLLVRL